ILHNAGTEKLNAVSAEIDAQEPGWRLDDLEAARMAARPADPVNSAIIVVELTGKTSEWWGKHRNSEEANFGSPSPHTPTIWQMIWMLQGRADTKAAREASRDRLLRPEVLSQPGGCYPIQHSDNPFMTLLPHVQKARELA